MSLSKVQFEKVVIILEKFNVSLDTAIQLATNDPLKNQDNLSEDQLIALEEYIP